MVVISISGTLRAQDWDNHRLTDLITKDTRLQEYVATCVLIVNDSLADVVATRESEFEVLWWTGIINESLHIQDNVLQFDISPLSFFQTNSTGAELLYSTAIQMVWWVDGAILDLYCGTGTIGIAFTKAYGDAMLVGIEEVESAVADAYKNAKTNAIQSDYHFFAGKVEKLLSMQAGKLTIKNTTGELIIDNQNLWLVIVDPPRSGLHEDAIQTLLELKQQTPALRVCYISCNPVTLARDLKLLSEHYEFDMVQPVDMFPHTYHVENIVILR